MKVDIRRVVEDKQIYRRRLIALPYIEKLAILDRLRKRALTMMTGRAVASAKANAKNRRRSSPWADSGIRGGCRTTAS